MSTKSNSGAFETIVGTPFADYIVGGEGGETIYGGGGADVIDGSGGDDQLFGGADGDFLDGGTGHELDRRRYRQRQLRQIASGSELRGNGEAVVPRDPGKVSVGVMGPGRRAHRSST